MTEPKLSIKWPTKASVSQRLRGLTHLASMLDKSRPEPYYSSFDKEGKWVKGKSATKDGKAWRASRAAVTQLIDEADALLKLIPCKPRAKKAVEAPAGDSK